jgi:YkoY family integral membrane protein
MDFLHSILGPDLGKAFFTILNIIFIESLLSVDNAAVLATLVRHLPKDHQTKALRIGLILAYIFRGTALLLAQYLIQIDWLKLVGGGYLLFLSLRFFYELILKDRGIMEEAKEEVKEHAPKRRILGLSPLWSTVIMVEIMDLVFSLDNVLAAVAYTDNIYIICIGVFIGIITMRIVAGYFVKLMHRFPFLDTMAFIVIGLLGLRLGLEYFMSVDPALVKIEQSHLIDMLFSFGTLAIFVIPILTSLAFGFPKGHKKTKKRTHADT